MQPGLFNFSVSYSGRPAITTMGGRQKHVNVLHPIAHDQEKH